MVTGTINKNGFTLIELMVAIAIIIILAAIAYPNYQKYVIKTKRADMMSEMQNIASQIESQKLLKGKYSSVSTSGLIGDYPRSGTALYTVAITPSPLTEKWVITATTKPTEQMKSDGNLTLSYSGQKCRIIDASNKKCGTDDEWRK